MDKKTFVIVLVYLAQAAQGQITKTERNQINYDFWTNNMDQKPFIEIKGIKETRVGRIISVLKSKGFKKNAITKIVIPGYTQNVTAIGNRFRKAYLAAKKDVNLLIVDWSHIARRPKYSYAAKSVDEVGVRISRRLLKAIKRVQGKLDKVHVIGQGLGSYVAGYAGREAKKQSLGKVGRITALDPIAEFFSVSFKDALTKNDAKLVDVIHTNGGELREGSIGRPDSFGHVDFFVNTKIQRRKPLFPFVFNQQRQPGCQVKIWDNYVELGRRFSDVSVCSHKRALELYLESIEVSNSKKPFESRQCAKWKNTSDNGRYAYGKECVEAKNEATKLHMGENLETKKARNFWLDSRFFLTTTDGKNGKYSKDEFEL